jgi:AcrR family transcriptional regulator
MNAPTRTARRRAATRAQLVDAAQELFGEQGFESTRINEITERADVGFGSFYNYFDSKEAIASAVIERAVEAHATAVDELVAAVDDPAEVMAVAHRYFVRMASSDPAWAWLLLRLNASHHVMVHILGVGAKRDLRAGVEAGRFTVPSEPVALLGFGGALLGVMRGVLDGSCSADADVHHAAGVLRMLGLTPEDAEDVANRPMPALPPGTGA